ncbi:hypothetical protein RND71_014042 [Anisodus tanguticus]|uniref:Uncharacterized protein n=1 Tax=Anisodus tanguticus TaxID=243964 RepID=A0AAE1SAN2_9SOLA|nr:hypothetical protein RND71_014042 [Anisodus tanguticus]
MEEKKGLVPCRKEEKMIGSLVFACEHSVIAVPRSGEFGAMRGFPAEPGDMIGRNSGHRGSRGNGGLLARQRKTELQRLNEQLRQINAALRRQAKIESYAPTLSYAPVGGRISESEVIIDPRKQELISHLKNGKTSEESSPREGIFGGHHYKGRASTRKPLNTTLWFLISRQEMERILGAQKLMEQ